MSRLRVASAMAILLLVSACGSRGSSTSAEPGLEGELLVFAAASLTDALAEVESAFEDTNPGVDIQLNLASSSALREQILEGAPADVFMSANASNMDQVIEADEATESEIFVTNLLQIAVPAGNSAGVTGLDDFADEALLIGLCAEEVPCGDFGRQALENAGVTPAVDTNEPDVRALLTKIAEDELDAGIVYVTDVLAPDFAEDVEGIDIPSDVNVLAEYPIAALTHAPNPDAAAAFVAFILSSEGQAILNDYGFGSP
ncbi:MAG TPA: molybdate ABC transporter substrate-binding protein [Candidatus Limnocylindria bacterium]